MTFQTAATMTIPDSAWEDTGPEGEEDSRRAARVEVNGIPFHAEAYLVETDANRVQVFRGDWSAAGKEALCVLNGGAKAYCLMPIRGREYAVVIRPASN